MNDQIHITLTVDDPSLINEIAVTIEMDEATTNDFSRNYFYRERES